MKLLTALMLCFFTLKAFAVLEATGVDGQTITLQRPAERVITLTPNLTEMVYAIGASKRLVAVGEDSNYPKAALKKMQIGGYKTLNYERILSLNPDLILAWRGANAESEIQELRRLKLRVLVLGYNNMMSIPKDMILIGRLTDHKGGGRGQAHLFQKRFKELVMKYALQKPEVKTVMQLGYPPLYVSGSKGMQADIINMCGGSNVFGSVRQASVPVTLEAVIRANPQAIIELGKQDISLWKHWGALAAVKNKAVVSVPASLLARPGPRVLRGAREVCEVLARVRKCLAI